jgi:hypothetical protein
MSSNSESKIPRLVNGALKKMEGNVGNKVFKNVLKWELLKLLRELFQNGLI